MEERNIGSSGLRVSTIGLGCNNFGGRIDAEGTRAVIHAALDAGITMFDTADMYGETRSESLLGEYLGPRRQDIVLATKFGWSAGAAARPGGGSRRYIMRALEDSLRRLRTDWIDIYYLHRPDPGTPVEETLRAMDDLIRQGKIRYVGCSNFAAWQVTEAHFTAKLHGLNGFICAQDEYSLLARGIERDLLPAVSAAGLGLLPYFPLASGLLTGKYRDGALPQGSRLARNANMANRFATPANRALADRLAEFAEARGHSLAELAFAWLLGRAQVPSVIAGATTAEQVAENVKAGGWVLSAEELKDIDRITAPA